MSTTCRGVVTVSKDVSGRIMVAFHYNPQLIAKAKTIHGYRWHKDKKHWSFPDSDGTLTPPSPLNLRGKRGELLNLESGQSEMRR